MVELEITGNEKDPSRLLFLYSDGEGAERQLILENNCGWEQFENG